MFPNIVTEYKECEMGCLDCDMCPYCFASKNETGIGCKKCTECVNDAKHKQKWWKDNEAK